MHHDLEATARRRFERDVTAIADHQLTHDREPEAEVSARATVAPCRCGLPEAVERARPILVRHPGSLVADPQLDAVVAVAGRDTHRAATRRDLERIVQEVVDDLFEATGRYPRHG